MIKEIEYEVDALTPFKKLYNLPKGTNIVVLIGGRGGGKTYEASKFTVVSAVALDKRCAILRDEKESIRESILNEVLIRYDSANEDGVLDTEFERLSNGIKNRKTTEMVVFTKGFRASTAIKKANLKSISNVDIAIVEEAEDIRDEDKFNTFADSIRKEGSLIIIILNTPDVQHWIVKRFFTIKQVVDYNGQPEDGYFELVPKSIDGFVCIQTSYLDNPYLPKKIVESYEEYGKVGSHKYNKHYYLTAIKGYASTGRKGQILKKVKPITLKDYLHLPYKEIYGLDFGTSSPAGLVGVKIHRNTIWWRQINYLPLSTLGIGKMLIDLGFTEVDEIVADSADRDAWTRLKNGWLEKDLDEETFLKYPRLLQGFNIRPAKKREVITGLDILDSMEIYLTEDSEDAWNEVANYVYTQNKSGEYTNQPVDAFNHTIDPLRYVVIDNIDNKKMIQSN